MNDVLAGSSDQQFLDRVGQLFLGNQPKGASVELTLDPKIQKLAYDLIPDGQRGSIVVTNPKTGADPGHGLQTVLRPQPDRHPGPSGRSRQITLS